MTPAQRALPAVFLALAVAVAFADSSIVVLGLPEIYAELDTSIAGVSWVVTAYNLVVAIGAVAVLPLLGRVRPYLIGFTGLVLFLVASVGCGIADSLPVLVTARCVQGLGAALALAASLPALAALTGSPAKARADWALAGAAGAAVGPALGGLLTQVASWRAIFIVQAPVALLAIVAMAVPVVRGLRPEGRPRPEPVTAPNLSLLFAFGALVGALFLAVLMVVTVWDMSPIAGALVVSTLPVAALLVRPLSGALPRNLDTTGGAVLLALGLVALAMLPASSPVVAGVALAVCGAGFGLAVPPLTRESVPGDEGLAWRGSTSVAARHAGLVLALIIIAPLIATGLERGGEVATLNATAVVLDARLPVQTKVPIALDLRDEFQRTPEGQVPDLARAFDENGAGDDEDVAAARDALVEAIRAPLTRGFRASYLVAALLALLVPVPLLVARLRRRPA